MTTDKKIWTTKTLIIFLSILLVGLTYLAYWIEGWTGAYLFMGAGLTAIVLIGFFVAGLVKMLKSKDKGLIVPLIIAVFAILIVVFRPLETLLEKLKSPVVLYGYCEHTVTALSIKLRQDRTFEYNAGAFLSREIYYGEYSLTGDTLKLNFNDNTPDNSKDKLLLKDSSVIEIGDTTKHRHHFRITYNDLIK
jgi:hypothetical protein